jgi:hypothetical protein
MTQKMGRIILQRWRHDTERETIKIRATRRRNVSITASLLHARD